MHITIKYKIPNYAIATKKEIIFTPLLAREMFKNVNYQLHFNPELKRRKYPFRDRCSRLVEINETIKLPDYKEKVNIPKVKDIDGSSATYSGGYKLTNDTLKLKQHIKFNKRKYQPDEWINFKNVVKSQKKLANESIILTK
jgi:hypothetical protein